MYFTYILYSDSADRYYIGYCADLSVRLIKHNNGATSSTKPYRPWRIVYTESFATKIEAINREKSIKRQKSRKYIKQLIESTG